METVLTSLQLFPELGLPGILSTILVILVALLVARILLNVAFKIAVLAAIVVGALWLVSSLWTLLF